MTAALAVHGPLKGRVVDTTRGGYVRAVELDPFTVDWRTPSLTPDATLRTNEVVYQEHRFTVGGRLWRILALGRSKPQIDTDALLALIDADPKDVRAVEVTR